VIGSLTGSRTRSLLAIVGIAALTFGGCTNRPSATASPASAEVTSPAEGIIVAVEATSLTDVHGFTLRTPGGGVLEFRLGTLENPTAFPPGHLAEHQATSAPVLVYFRVENGERVVYRLEDALPSPGAPAAT
jgi:hypothetical protein